MRQICKGFILVALVVCMVTLTTPVRVFAAHSHADACYCGTKHSHTTECNGVVGYCDGYETNCFRTESQEVYCGTYSQYKYGTYDNSRTPSGTGWCSNNGGHSYDIGASSTWIEIYCSGCNQEVHHEHYAVCPVCGADVESRYNWSDDDHACYYTECSGCTDRGGSVGATHYKTVYVDYYECAKCHGGNTTSYGGRCGRAITGITCGKSDSKWYLNGGEDSPICNNVVITMTFR